MLPMLCCNFALDLTRGLLFHRKVVWDASHDFLKKYVLGKCSKSDPKVTPEWSQDDPSMILRLPENDPRSTPKWSQDDPRMIPRRPQNSPKTTPRWSKIMTSSHELEWFLCGKTIISAYELSSAFGQQPPPREGSVLCLRVEHHCPILEGGNARNLLFCPFWSWFVSRKLKNK